MKAPKKKDTQGCPGKWRLSCSGARIGKDRVSWPVQQISAVLAEPHLVDPAGRERERALRAGTTGPGGNSSSLGSLVGNRGPDRGRIVSVPQWQGQNSVSSKLVEPLAKSRSQPADRLRSLSLLLPTAPAFCHRGSANHAASVHFSFPPEEGERLPCPFSLKGACQRASVKAG